MWAVRGVEGDVGEERFARSAAGVHPLVGLIEEPVGAIAFGLFELSIVPERWVDVGIVRRIATRSGKSLSDAATVGHDEDDVGLLAGNRFNQTRKD